MQLLESYPFVLFLLNFYLFSDPFGNTDFIIFLDLYRLFLLFSSLLALKSQLLLLIFFFARNATLGGGDPIGHLQRQQSLYFFTLVGSYIYLFHSLFLLIFPFFSVLLFCDAQYHKACLNHAFLWLYIPDVLRILLAYRRSRVYFRLLFR